MADDAMRIWLKALGALCAGSMPLAEAEARIAAYAPMLAGRFDAPAFCPASLEFVAGESKFWPSYGEVVDRLSRWWHDNRPVQPALSAPESSTLTASEATWVAYAHRRFAEGRPPLLVLSMVRNHGGKRALAEVIRGDQPLIATASSAGWITEERELAEQLGPAQAPRVKDGLWVM